jgi:hypothetical protein
MEGDSERGVPGVESGTPSPAALVGLPLCTCPAEVVDRSSVGRVGDA